MSLWAARPSSAPPIFAAKSPSGHKPSRTRTSASSDTAPLNNAVERQLKEPDFIVGALDGLVRRLDHPDQFFKRPLVRKGNHQYGINARGAPSAQMRLRTVAFSFDLVPASVVIDACVYQQLHQLRGKILVVHYKRDFHGIGPRLDWLQDSPTLNPVY